MGDRYKLLWDIRKKKYFQLVVLGTVSTIIERNLSEIGHIFS